MKNEIIAYFLKHFRIFEENYLISRDRFDMAAIHKMRVSIKRTRILFELFEYVDPVNFNAKIEFKGIKTLFKLVGAIRDIQVQRKLIEKFESDLTQDFSDYKQFLERHEYLAIHKFENKLNKTLINKALINLEKINNIINGMSNESGVKKIIALINKKTALFNALGNNLDDDENIHKIRIILKQINFLLELSKKSFPAGMFIEIPHERLDNIQKLFGEWHDHINALMYIRSYRNKEGISDNRVEVLEFHIQCNKNILHQQIIQVMDNELKFKNVIE